MPCGYRCSKNPEDYSAFEKGLGEAYERTNVPIAAYYLMPNHWHLLLWLRHDGELSEVMRWITVTHTQRWHAHRHSSAASGAGRAYSSTTGYGKRLKYRNQKFSRVK